MNPADWISEFVRAAHAARVAASHQPAVISERGTVSWGALCDRAGAIAAGLAEAGVGAGDRVVLLFRNHPDFVVVFLACRWLGAVAVPCHPGYGREQVERLVGEVAPRALICDDGDDARAIAAGLDGVPTIATAGAAASLERGGKMNALADWRGPAIEPRAIDPDLPMVLLSSSGSTGTPKLVIRSERRFAAAARGFGEHWGCRPGARFAIGSMIGHAAALGWGVQAALLGGATLIVPIDRSAAGLLAAMAAHGAEAVFMVPAQLRALVATDGPTLQLRRIIVGGERFDPALARAAADRFGCEVQDTYGLTEGFCSATAPGDLADIEAGTVGRPCFADDRVEIRDGELWVRSRGLLDGYWERAPRPAPLDARGFFATGDLGSVDDDGRIRWTGRSRRLVNRGGVKLSPEELEIALRTCAAIDEVVVVAAPDAALGERAVAVVVPRDPAAPPALLDLRRHLEGRGIGRLRHPDDLVIVAALARNPIGKIDWRAVANQITDRNSTGGTS